MSSQEKNNVRDILISSLLSEKNQTDEPVAGVLSGLRYENPEHPVIFVGAGTCGLGAGAGKTREAIKEYLDRNGLKASVVSVGCIGLCSSEPIVDVLIPGFNRISFEQVTADRVEGLLSRIFALELPENGVLGQFRATGEKHWEGVHYLDEHPFFAPQERVVLKNCGVISPVSIEEYIASGGYASLVKTLREMTPAEVIAEVEKAGLRGRGGGGFPTAMKWKLAAREQADQKYLICNADEGDPGAFMDRAVVEGDPHRLVEGMAIAGYAMGATKAYVYIRAEYPLAIERLKTALSQAREYDLLGENILGTGVSFDIIMKMGAGAFVCGEETALMHSIEGKRGMPRPRPPFPTTSGLFGKPTVINNVETLANVPGIFEKGSDWFASLGTEKSKGTKVFALSGKIVRTGLVEIPMGTTIRDIIYIIGGGIRNGKKFKAVQIGGPSGGCITEQNLDIEVDYDSLLKVGAMMGSGGMVVMDEDTCMVDVAMFFMDFIQRESCGKCIPCREGTRRMLEILKSITEKPANGSADALKRFKGVLQLEKLGRVIKETSLCGLGKSAPNPVLSTLKWFRDEYEAHIYDRVCPAGVCTGLRTFRINVDLCTGCTACVRKCPTGAIIGSRKSPHFILEEKCIGCGSCQETCKFHAIEVVS
ncbi:MAG TPA: 4Fe-4S dicluster domain-containing protein [Bacteroidetes bacterium]|nr:4Fe-4S dicluster domain-containing protein [Bacteroidota bacterium]